MTFTRAIVLACAGAVFTLCATTSTDGAVLVHLKLIDAGSGKTLPGMVRITPDETDTPIAPPGLLRRVGHWYSVPEPTSVLLPAGRYTVEAVAGLETETGRIDIDAESGLVSAAVGLTRFADLRAENRFGGNTHLHLNRMTRAEADRYLHQHPTADNLDVLFISHLTRADDDRHYITNEYDIGPQPGLSTDATIVNNGEEHRHNFGPGGEGFGHVMLLDIKRLITPVSIGPGITKSGYDSRPLRVAIDETHSQGGRAIWCHNDFGFEDVPNLVTGRLDAVNIFDGGSRGGYEQTFYLYLNAGFRVPFSTGTDWGLYDYSRAYTTVDGALGIRPWLDALADGRSFITNGPLLWLSVNDRRPGGTVDLPAGGGELRVTARCSGRHDFGQLQLVQAGKIVHTVSARPVGGHFEAAFERTIKVDAPSWLALRIDGGRNNEFDKQLFGHTSAVYVNVDKKRIRRPEAVAALRERIAAGRAALLEKASFSNEREKREILAVYDQAADVLHAKPFASP